MRFLRNTHADRSDWAQPLDRRPLEVHRRLPGYAPTPLHRLTAAANQTGIGELLIKDESHRLTLPAFKVLGASWAVVRWLEEKTGGTLEPWRDVTDLRRQLDSYKPLTLVTATDGNHGRGVACVAKWLGLEAEVYVPRGTVPARVKGIESEGARVTVVDGDYDKAVRTAAAQADERHLLVQDTARPGYETIPGWIVEGYSTLLWEIEDVLTGAIPDLVFAPVGVGSLAAAMARHYCRKGIAKRPRILAVEPVGAGCLLESLRADRMVTVPEGDGTVMAGLNCGTLSTIAWPLLRRGIDAALEMDDVWALKAMK